MGEVILELSWQLDKEIQRTSEFYLVRGPWAQNIFMRFLWSLILARGAS